MFEINEEEISLRPWFSTASAYFITAVNEMLIQRKQNGNIALLPCVPEQVSDVKFKLSTHGAVSVEFEMINNKVTKLIVNGMSDEYKIELPNGITFDGNIVQKSNDIICYAVKSGAEEK
jgi:cellobiose phosphorylase